RVLEIEYGDRHGSLTRRQIEPMGYVGNRSHWYLVAWCRLRRSVRAFRTDRIGSVRPSGESAPPRVLDPAALGIPDPVSPITLG
ncbi:MAG TPA: WYL domain-containing protein, partial [Pilimelia sp.]|nr:WYL domain-containing protein [Pilimelia sp.]